MKMRISICILLMLVLGGRISLLAQTPDRRAVEVSSEQYDKLGEELDYSKTRKKIMIKESGKDTPEKFELDTPSEQGGFFSLLAFMAVGILVAFIIYIVFSRIKIEEKIKPVVDQTPEINELETINTEEEYATAIRTGEYRLAVRMQFLKVLQYLSENEFIDWEPDKTNGEYLREIRQSHFYPLVRQLVQIYEVVWYGNTTLGEVEFRRVDPLFKEFFKAGT